MSIKASDSLNVSNSYKVENEDKLTKLVSSIFDAQIVTHDDGSPEYIDEQPTAAVIENDNVTVTVMNVTNDTNIQVGSNNNATETVVVQLNNDLFTTATIVNRETLPPSSEVSTKQINRTAVTDAERRLTHNQIERRRRDKINQWIMCMSQIIPDCAEGNKTNNYNQSKGRILAKACEYINELKSNNQILTEHLKQMEAVSRCNDELRMENEEFKDILSQHGLLFKRDDDSHENY